MLSLQQCGWVVRAEMIGDIKEERGGHEHLCSSDVQRIRSFFETVLLEQRRSQFHWGCRAEGVVATYAGVKAT